MTSTAIRLRELERTAAVNKTLFEDFLQRVQGHRGAVDLRAARGSHHHPGAAAGRRRAIRARFHSCSLNLCSGCCFGVGGAVAKEMLNSGFTMTKQVEDMLGLPMLASVSRLGERDLTVDGTVVPIYEYPAVKAAVALQRIDQVAAQRHPYDRCGSSAQGRAIHLCGSGRRQDHDRAGGGALGGPVAAQGSADRRRPAPSLGVADV